MNVSAGAAGAWVGFSTRGFATVTTADVHVYVDPVNGNDNNSGTQASPIQTLLEADARIPLFVFHLVYVHLKSGIYVLPSRGWFLSGGRSIAKTGLIRIYADEVWDASLFPTVDTGTAQPGTGALVLVTSGGLAVDGLRNQSLRFADGAAAGQRRDIRDNDAASITPSCEWFAAYGVPAAGDTWETFDVGQCVLQAPLGGQPLQEYELVQQTGGNPGLLMGYASPYGSVVFEGFAVDVADPASYGNWTVNADQFYGFGWRVLNGTNPVINSDAAYLGLPYWDLVAPTLFPELVASYGWSIRCAGLPRLNEVRDGYAIGFCNAEDDAALLQPGGRVTIVGGRVPTVATEFPVHLRFSDESTFQIRALSSVTGYGIRQRFGRSDGNLRQQFLDQTSTQGALFEAPACSAVLVAGNATLANATPGSTVVTVRYGATLQVDGAPDNFTTSTLGTPVLDWMLDGAPLDPVAALPAAGSYVIGPLGSVIVRGS